MRLSFEIKDLKFSTSSAHINIMRWEGVVTKVGVPSDGVPGGAEQRVVFTRDCIESNYQTLNKMPLNCTFPEGFFADGTDVFTGHGDIIIGYIEETWIDGENLMAKGVIWKENFPDISFMILNGKNSLGFSIEAIVNKTHDREDGFLYIDDLTFVGCAILWQNTAAFSDTKLTELAAKRKDDVKMTKEELQALFAEFGATVDEKVNIIMASFEKINERFDEIVKAQKEEVINEEITALKIENEELKQKLTELDTLKAENDELKQKLESKEPQRTTLQFASVIDKFNKQDEVKVDTSKPLVNQFAEIFKTKFGK